MDLSYHVSFLFLDLKFLRHAAFQTLQYGKCKCPNYDCREAGLSMPKLNKIFSKLLHLCTYVLNTKSLCQSQYIEYLFTVSQVIVHLTPQSTWETRVIYSLLTSVYLDFWLSFSKVFQSEQFSWRFWLPYFKNIIYMLLSQVFHLQVVFLTLHAPSVLE